MTTEATPVRSMTVACAAIDAAEDHAAAGCSLAESLLDAYSPEWADAIRADFVMMADALCPGWDH